MPRYLQCTARGPLHIVPQSFHSRIIPPQGFSPDRRVKEGNNTLNRSRMGYEEARDGKDQRTAFRLAEKFYKRYKESATRARRRGGTRKNRSGDVPETDLSQLLDFGNILEEVRMSGAPSSPGVELLHGPWPWPVFTLTKNPGFYFIPGAISPEGQRHLTEACLGTYVEPPNRTNHNAAYGPIHGLWKAAQQDAFSAHQPAAPSSPGSGVQDGVGGGRGGEEVEGEASPGGWRGWSGREERVDGGAKKERAARTLLRKLRWATLGIQFDWAKRGYNEHLRHAPFPQDLAELAAELAAPALPPGQKFKAEAAIVNFYGPDDTLGGHLDDMEADWTKPIVSISIGCDAVFLLGGPSKEQAPTPMRLRSGDCVLMAGEARQCHHEIAVCASWLRMEWRTPNGTNVDHSSFLRGMTGIPRILTAMETMASAGSTAQLEDAFGPYAKYMEDSRININVRQVY